MNYMNYTYEGSIAQAFDIGYNGVYGQGMYKGKLIHKYFKFIKFGYFKFNFKIVSKKSRYLQAVVLMMSRIFTAEFYINGKKIAKPKGRFPKIELWENDVPQEFSVFVHLSEGEIYILNGNAVPVAQNIIYCRMMQGGCAILIEKLEGERYLFNCNDVDIDDDFDDLVFEFDFIEFSDPQEWLKMAKMKSKN